MVLILSHVVYNVQNIKLYEDLMKPTFFNWCNNFTALTSHSAIAFREASEELQIGKLEMILMSDEEDSELSISDLKHTYAHFD